MNVDETVIKIENLGKRYMLMIRQLGSTRHRESSGHSKD